MLISVLAHSADRNVRPVECSWEELTSWKSVETSDKKNFPLWSPIVWDGYAKIVKAKVVEPILVLDFDHRPWSELFEFFARAPCEWHLHTTWRHLSLEDEEARARVLLRLSRRVEIHEWSKFWERAVDFLGVADRVDDSCRGLDRAFFLPCHRPGAEPIAERGGEGLIDVDAILSRPAPVRVFNRIELAPEGGLPIPRDSLEGLAKKLSRSSSGDKQTLGYYLKLVVKGEPFAEPGNRDNILYRLACTIAENFPTGDPASIARHFAESLQLMGEDAPTPEAVREKVARKQRDLKKERDESDEALVHRIREAFGGQRASPYSPEELSAFGDMIHRWILSDGVSAWFFIDGEYRPVRLHAMVAAARTYLAPAITAGVELTKVVRGEVIEKGPQELLKDYGQQIERVEHDLVTSRTVFLQDRSTLVVSHGKCREISPARHSDVEEWLSVLCGENVDFVLDWLSVARRLDQPIPALLLYGESGVGKNLLALGLARLWTDRGPTALEDVMTDGFNEAILQCPVLFADEKIPTNFRGVPKTEELRRLITADSFSLRQKYMADTRISGAVRVVVGVQKLDAVFAESELNDHDIRAIGDRFIVVKCSSAAREWLKCRGGRRFTEGWVSGEAIAEHVLWLERTREAKKGERMIIPGNAGELVRSLRVETGLRWSIMFWIYEFLKRPQIHMNRIQTESPAVRIAPSEGSRYPFRILINPHRIVQCWRTYLPESSNDPHVQRASKAIRDISAPTDFKFQGRVYRELDITALVDWIDSQDEDIRVLEETLRNGSFSLDEHPQLN